MRLKFLFFPVMLVISLSIFAGYIWPEISDLKQANSDKVSELASLQAIKDKQTAIDRISGQIQNDTSGEDVVNNYLPNTKVEERILTGVNFLASDSSVSLINITLKDGTTSPASAPAETGAPSADTSGAAAKPTALSGLQYTEAAISVSGTYDKIRLFADQLQRVPIFNFVKSLTITPPDGSTDPNAKVDPSVLYANFVVDFGYMGLVRMDNSKVANFQSNIDTDTIAVVKQYISQKAPAVVSNGDDLGKSNPFLP